MKEFFDKLEANYLDKISPEAVLLTLAVIIVFYFLKWIAKKIKNAPHMEKCDNCGNFYLYDKMRWVEEEGKVPKLLCERC